MGFPAFGMFVAFCALFCKLYNTEAIYAHPFSLGNEIIWKGEQSIADVKKVCAKNNIHLVRYQFCRKGGLFDQQPVKAAPGLVPLKKGLDTEKYGGYNKPAASFFAPVKYTQGDKTDLMIMPVDLMISDRFLEDRQFALEYSAKTVSLITGHPVTNVSFPFGNRICKIGTVFSLDGFRVCLSGKSNGGANILLKSNESIKVDAMTEAYIKSITKYSEKVKGNPSIVLNEEYDGISKDKNLVLYKVYVSKAGSGLFRKMPANQEKLLNDGIELFKKLSLPQQISTLCSIVNFYKTGRSGGCDFEAIGGSKSTGSMLLSSMVSNWKKYYKDVRIIDQSAAGLFEKVSKENLLDLV